MELNLYSTKGRKLNKKIKLDESVFGAKVNHSLMRTAVHVYLSNQRQSAAHTKTRGVVRGGGAKPWRQKGTGRARHGSIRSPIWKGGGIAFGPLKERNYRKKLTKKTRKAAIRSVFSFFIKKKGVFILEGIDFDKEHLTKQVIGLTKKLPVEEKVLYIQKGNLKDLYLGSRNLKKVNVITVNEVNVFTLLNHKSLVILKDALDDISKFWGSTTKVTKKDDVEKTEGRRRIRSVRKKLVGKKETRKEKLVGELKLSTRIINVLTKKGVKTQRTLEDKIRKGEKIKGIGGKGLEEIKKVLKIK